MIVGPLVAPPVAQAQAPRAQAPRVQPQASFKPSTPSPPAAAAVDEMSAAQKKRQGPV
jgi:hypothetical protein